MSMSIADALRALADHLLGRRPAPAPVRSGRSHRVRTIGTGLVLVAAAGMTTTGHAQETTDDDTATSGSEVRIVPLDASGKPAADLAPDYEPAQPDRDFLRNQHKFERQIRRIRFRYLGDMRNQTVRREGLTELERFTDPAALEPLLGVLAEEQPDVREWTLDHLRDRGAREYGQPTLAFLAIHHEDETWRSSALERLQPEPAEPRTRYIVQHALTSPNHMIANHGALVVQRMKLLEAIPWLINAQTFTTGGGGGGGGPTNTANLVIGTQRYFVSDLVPVVGNSSAGFAPTLSSVFEGTIISIQDAVVTFQRVRVHDVLRGLIRDDFGRPIDYGYDVEKWREWYASTYVPFKLAQAAGGPDVAPPAAPDDDGLTREDLLRDG